MIPLTKPFFSEEDSKVLTRVLKNKNLTDGFYQKQCEGIIKEKIKSKFVALTHSCTAALEISAILLNLKKGDEVIMPSYGFVSLANAVALRGAKIIFTDVDSETLNISVKDLKKKITKKTKAIYIIHYGGNACDMDSIIKIARDKKIYLVEDAAHAFLGKYKKKNLGTLGDIGVFSFHESKNLVAGQGGCISINNPKFLKRINYILDKGTNRSEFIKDYKKKIISANNKKFYTWVDFGSEYRAPELTAALLYTQLKKIKFIQSKRKKTWNIYKKTISKTKTQLFKLLEPKENCEGAYHLIVLIFKKKQIARNFMKFMQNKGIACTFHYTPLHKSKMAKKIGNKKNIIKNVEKVYSNVARLPLYPTLKKNEIEKIMSSISRFTKNYGK